MKVEKGNKIKVEYVGKLESGEIFDSTQLHSGEPLEFTAGIGEMISGFDKAVIGMELNEEKEITLPPEESYGGPNPEFIQSIPIKNFPPNAFAQLKEGMQIVLPMPDGNKIPANVTKITNTHVTFDMNNPLAGKTLIFQLKIVDIQK